MPNAENNPYISFYGTHHVSPVHQNIEDLRRHKMRREKLYRKLGIAPCTFKNKRILEIGPGGGYNSVVLFDWGATVDFVEPNPKAQEELPTLLDKHNVPKDKWNLFKEKIEEFKTDKCYDIVLAEGFIPGLYNRTEVIGRIIELVNPGGIAVVTCIDDISFLLENLRRIIAVKLTVGVEDFWGKVEKLSRAFGTHLEKINYSSRPVEDWVIDQLLNPALFGELFSMGDCINEFGKDFDILGSSPQMFTDWSWYKDLDFSSSALEQFESQRHALIKSNCKPTTRAREDNNLLLNAAKDLRLLSLEFEKNPNNENLHAVILVMKRLKIMVEEFNKEVCEAIDETIKLLSDNYLSVERVAKAERLAGAFGRGQQYVSMVKKYTL